MSLSKFICNIVDVMKSVYYSKPEIDAKVDSLNNAITNKSNIGHTHNTLSKTILGPGADFNNYKEEGIYLLSWADSQSASNLPVVQGGRLEVKDLLGGTIQIFYPYVPYETIMLIYYRIYYNSGTAWMGWKKLDNSPIV